MTSADKMNAQDAMFRLAEIAENKGNMAAAVALADRASEMTDFVPYAYVPSKSPRKK